MRLFVRGGGSEGRHGMLLCGVLTNGLTYQGQMILHLIPCAGAVRRRLCIMPRTPHLLAPYWGAVGMSRYPARLAVMTSSLSFFWSALLSRGR